MASRTLDVTLNAKDNITAVLNKAGNSAKTFGQALEGIGKSNTGLDSVLSQISAVEQDMNRAGQALVGFGAGVTGAIALSVRSFAQLEQAMANVASIAGNADIGAMTDQVRALSVELGVSPTGLAEGLYELISTGISAADSLDVLRASAIAARAGMTDTGTAAKAITSVLNAYGLEADQAANVSDVLFQTVNEGGLSFSELANNMSNVIPLASNLNVGIEEVAAAYKELTIQSFSAATAETAVAAILRSAINPTEELTDAVREYGYASVEALVQAEGLSGLLKVLEENTHGSAAALLELLGTSEATTGALALLSGGADQFAVDAEHMNASMQDGATTMATYEKQAATLSASIDRAQQSFNFLAVTVGGNIAPAIGAVADAAQTAALGISMLPGPLQAAASYMGAFAGGSALLAGGLLLVVPKIAETVTALQRLRAAIAATRFAGAIGGVAGLGAVATVASVAIAGMVVETQNMVQASHDLDAAWRDLKLSGLEDPANDLKDIRAEINGLIDDLGSGNFEWLPFGTGGIDVPADVKAGISDVLRQAVTDSRVDYAEFFGWIHTELANLDTDAEKMDFLRELADPDILIKFRKEVDSTTDSLDRNAESMARAQGAMSAMLGSLGEMPASFHDAAEANKQAREELQKLREEWIQSALAAGGFDDALSQMNLAGAANDVSMFAEGWQNANEALDSTFRIIVGTTNGIIQQVDGIQSWADSLINVRGELGRIDELLSDKFIDKTIYDEAQNAYDDIAASVFTIKGNLQAVQAIQAPFIADAIAGTARWSEELRGMPADVQRITLAFMDMQTVQQAQELVALANASAFNTMGEEGTAAFEAMIRGAAQTNPLLLDVLDTMGYITKAGDDFTINWDAIADDGGNLRALTENIRALVDSLREIYGLPPIKLEADASSFEQALQTVDFVYKRVQEADGTEAFMIVRVDEAGKETVDQIVSSVNNLDGTYTVQVEAETGETYEAILAEDGTVISTTYVDVQMRVVGGGGAAGESLAGLAESLGIPETITTTVTANVEGGEEIAAVRDQVTEINGLTATVTIDADDSDAQAAAAYWAGYNGITFASVEVAITGNAGGPDGILTVLDNLTLGGKESRDIAIDITATDNATSVIDTVALNMAQINGATPGITVVGTDDASDEIAAVSSNLQAINGDTATVYINAVDSASGVIGSVAGSLASIDGRVATSYVNTVQTTTYQTIGSRPYQHGGLLSFASGGLVPFWGAEGNRAEVAHFAGGGTALLPREGLYAAPPMTVISPANANPGAGGLSISIDFSGATFHNTSRAEMNAWAEQDFIPKVTKAIGDRQRSYGEAR